MNYKHGLPGHHRAIDNEVESVRAPMFVFYKKIFYYVQLGLRYVRRSTLVTST